MRKGWLSLTFGIIHYKLWQKDNSKSYDYGKTISKVHE